MIHTCNSSYLGVWGQKDHSSGPAMAKSMWDSHLNQWLCPVVYAYHSSYVEETIRRISVQAGMDIKWDLLSKITSAKWTSGLSQVVEYLPCKYEALSSTPPNNTHTHTHTHTHTNCLAITALSFLYTCFKLLFKISQTKSLFQILFSVLLGNTKAGP
jgi:hypothetical protein